MEYKVPFVGEKMPVVRKSSIQLIRDIFCLETVRWDHNKKQNSFYRYILKNGVFHLLEQNRRDEAMNRMGEIYFMSSFLDSWESFIEPLQVCRIVGLEIIEETFQVTGNDLPPIEQSSVEKGNLVYNISSFLSDAGLYNSSTKLALWSFEVLQYHLGKEDPNTLILMNNLAGCYIGQGRYDDAEPLFTETLEIRKRILGKEHPHVVI